MLDDLASAQLDDRLRVKDEALLEHRPLDPVDTASVSVSRRCCSSRRLRAVMSLEDQDRAAQAVVGPERRAV